VIDHVNFPRRVEKKIQAINSLSARANDSRDELNIVVIRQFFNRNTHGSTYERNQDV